MARGLRLFDSLLHNERPNGVPGSGLDGGRSGSLKSAQPAAQSKEASSIPYGYDETFNTVFAEKFQRRQEKYLKKKLINKIRRPCVFFIAPDSITGVDEERMRQYFDERYVVDDGGFDPAVLTKYKRSASMGYGCETAIRSIMKLNADETPLVLVQLMRDLCQDDKKLKFQNSDLLVDPSNFKVHSEIENMHYKVAGGKIGYCYISSNYSGKEEGETLSEVLGYNIRVCASMGDT